MAFKKPEEISALKKEEVATLISEIAAEATELTAIADSDLTDEQVDRLAELADARIALTAHSDALETAEAERAEKIAASRSALAEPAVDEVAQDENETTENGDEAEDVTVETAEVVEEEKELVTASAARPLSKIAAKAGRPVEAETVVEETRPGFSIIAAAGIADVEAGTDLTDTFALAGAAISKARSFRNLDGKKNTRSEALPVATIHRPKREFALNGQPGHDTGVLLDAGRESRLEGGSLIAAGGWCAPSETLYGLCNVGTTLEGLIDVPTVNVSRGGVRYTKAAQFPQFYGSSFHFTEQQIIDGVEKPCFDLECPEFDEERLDAYGLCVTAPLLTRAAYPELIEDTVQKLLQAHEHQRSAAIINKILGFITGTSLGTVANPWANAMAPVEAIALVIEGERQRYRLSLTATLEVLLPFWFKSALRADLAQRTGVNLLAITDAQINEIFSARGARVQWLYNWQELDILDGSPATASPALDYPATLQAILYPAGSYVAGSEDVIRLDTVYDSTNLKMNQYTQLFTEEGLLVFNPCGDGRSVSLALNVTGLTAAAVINQDYNGTPPAYEEA